MRLKERITFLNVVTADDEAGGTTGTISKDYQCWADVIFSSSNRGQWEGQTINQNIVQVKMRYNKIFIPEQGQTFIWRNKVLTIHGPVDLGERNFLKFTSAYDAAKDYE